MIPKKDLEELRDIHAHLPFAEPMVQVPEPENDGLNWDVIGNIGLHNLG